MTNNEWHWMCSRAKIIPGKLAKDEEKAQRALGLLNVYLVRLQEIETVIQWVKPVSPAKWFIIITNSIVEAFRIGREQAQFSGKYRIRPKIRVIPDEIIKELDI